MNTVVNFSHSNICMMGEFYARNLIMDIFKYPHMKRKHLPITNKELNEFQYDTEELIENIRKNLLKVIRYSCCAEFRHFSTEALSYDDKILNDCFFKSDNELEFIKSFIRNCPNPECFYYCGERSIHKKNRNMYKNAYNIWKYSGDYNSANKKLLKAFKHDEYKLMNNILFGFNKYRWESSYGGNPWAEGVRAWFMLYNAKTYQDKVIAIDHAYDLQHHGGVLFNKDDSWNHLDSEVYDFLERKKTAKNITQILVEEYGDSEEIYKNIHCRPKFYNKILKLSYKIGWI